ncbi:peptide-methionine (S)-S-oxide reductase [Pedobacter sp. W3I1]|nr:peptide-methionine (S)-S-oxide reductase [Pedobacter sp. W3I1]
MIASLRMKINKHKMKKIILILLSVLALNQTQAQGKKTEKATFGMGCFWCTEAIFQRLKGVISVKSGYEGGTLTNPTYEEVCTGATGHAEVLEITYNPMVISYDDLLEVFWKSHDPTTLNRQGADSGTQYRSVVFYHTAEQKALAEKYKAELNKTNAYGKKVVTAIEAAKPFYIAENYHQNYFNKNGSEPYCRLVIQPKIEKLEKIFKAKLKN